MAISSQNTPPSKHAGTTALIQGFDNAAPAADSTIVYHPHSRAAQRQGTLWEMIRHMSSRFFGAAVFIAHLPFAAADAGEDFSNNLLSDLAPILALFGENVAQQYMSQSMSWVEDLIFAVAPLGVITAMVGAIRVGGPNWLKAIIGRIRESEGTVEFELMSSCSEDVCELWNGKGIIRVLGKSPILELYYFEPTGAAASQSGGSSGLNPFIFRFETWLISNPQPAVLWSGMMSQFR
jgi:hypothetical protein